MVLSESIRDSQSRAGGLRSRRGLAGGGRLACLATGQRAVSTMQAGGIDSLNVPGGLQGDVEPPERLSFARLFCGGAYEDGGCCQHEDAGDFSRAGTKSRRVDGRGGATAWASA